MSSYSLFCSSQSVSVSDIFRLDKSSHCYHETTKLLYKRHIFIDESVYSLEKNDLIQSVAWLIVTKK